MRLCGHLLDLNIVFILVGLVVLLVPHGSPTDLNKELVAVAATALAALSLAARFAVVRSAALSRRSRIGVWVAVVMLELMLAVVAVFALGFAGVALSFFAGVTAMLCCAGLLSAFRSPAH